MNIDTVQYHKAVPTVGTKEGDAALREKTDQFEAIIVKMMLDEAMKEEKNLFSANDPGENDILTRQLMHYLHLLPLPQQEVVRSVYLQDQTLQEISDRLQVPLGTIKSRLRLGLMKLREQIEQEREYD